MATRLLLLSFLLLSNKVANGAIAFDAASSGTTGTISHTVSGIDRLLVVAAFSDTSITSWRPVSSITYNGVNLTKITSREANNLRMELWYLIAPDTGTHDIVITWGGPAGKGGGGISLTGVAQTGQPDASGNSGGISASCSVSITTVAANTWGVGAHVWEGTGYTLTVGSGQTERFQDTTGVSFAGSTEPKTGAGTLTMSYTSSVSDETACGIASFSEATGGGSPSRRIWTF